MHLITGHFGARMAPAETREFGRTRVIPEPGADNPLLQDFPAEGSYTWMSHNDSLQDVPQEVQINARTAAGLAAAMRVVGRPLFGVQFHPEVSHTELGTEVLRRFAFEVCGAAGDWSAGNLVQQKVEEIAQTVGSARVICGLSGGVDSAVTAALIARAVGRQLVCILVDNGLLRHAEADEVAALFRERFDVELRVVDAQREFLGALAGVVDPEAKRKAIGKTFIDVFEAAASDVEGVEYLAQGTLYPDVVESAGVRGPSAVIKSHHNVGGLPERLPFTLLEPLRNLFKDEVRDLGRAMGLPRRIIGRHPFPGPGLAVRILGEVTEERLAIVREADRIYIESLHELDLYDQIWQAFAVLLPVRTVGVMGDARTYERVLALRAVTSRDGMTADRAHLPMEALGRIADRITNNVAGVNRVVYDLSSKPPATIEWE
jgi:GMP synthase (glutamine-hydrolysing)